MSTERDIELIDHLLAADGESECVEFKQNNADPAIIGRYCSALANAAALHGRDFGYVIWGIDDGTRQVVGTSFEPNRKKAAQEPLAFWLANRLQPGLLIDFREVAHPQGRVILLTIPAATTAPVSFERDAYIRIGSATPRLADHPDHHQKLIANLSQSPWEAGIAAHSVTEDGVFDLLSIAAYFGRTNQPIPFDRTDILAILAQENLIKQDFPGRWHVTNLGAILFGHSLSGFGPAIARKGVRLAVYDGANKTGKVIHSVDGDKGYALGFEGLINEIGRYLPRNEHIGDALRVDTHLFPLLMVRELVANALVHQDFNITGAGPMIEIFRNRMEIANPGKPLVETDRMIDLPPRSRNAAMASLMRRIGICEERGSGLDKVVQQAELFQLPAPLLRSSHDAMQVFIYGPRKFSQMTPDERVRACYQHAILKWISESKLTNRSLRERLGIADQNAAQASTVIKNAIDRKLIKTADERHPRSGYLPIWA